MAGAYAAIVSLMNTAEQIQNHPLLSTSLDHCQIEILREKWSRSKTTLYFPLLLIIARLRSSTKRFFFFLDFMLTVEKGQTLAKETALLQCKKEAIEALPEHLKEAALVPDLTPSPANRFMATLTPPIEGYSEKINDAAARKSVEGKKRR